MKAVIQRVSNADVVVEDQTIASIQKGILVLLGITYSDTQQDVKWLSHKIASLRIFQDQDGKMNRSVCDVDGQIIVVSQFTLLASTKKGTRPSYINAASPEIALPLYEDFKKQLFQDTNIEVQSGIFGADMKVSLCNYGPVTIIIDTHHKI